MTNFSLLLACIRSGQVSAAQIAEHLKDPLFAAYWRKHLRISGQV